MSDGEEPADDGDERETHVGGGADHAGENGTVFLRPDFHHEGDAEGPLATHPERGDEACAGEMPGRLREPNQTGEH